MSFLKYLTFILLCVLLASSPAFAQSPISLDDLSAFQKPTKNWHIVGAVTADLEKKNSLTTQKGQGVLVNQMDRAKKPKDIYTTLEHGDIDLELDYLMAKGSNSGIYLQGRYEVQLLDSWGDTRVRSGGNGGIYERWDESKPQGQKGYQGYAPRQNVSRAPGLWQKLKISFQAPRFGGNGEKTEDAKILRVELNGVTIHENVTMLGPTRGAMADDEVATGPLRFQGDHGSVAFRNIKVTQYDKPRPELTDLTYQIYGGKYELEPAYDSLPPEAEGNSVVLTSDLRPKSAQYIIRYRGTLRVQEPGDYTFNLDVPGGGGILRVDGQEVVSLNADETSGKVSLSAGNLPFELAYSKHVDWVQPALGLRVVGPGIREYLLTDELASRREPVDPILVDPQEKPILRSFMDVPDGPRVTHAVSVGSPQQLHYTYDLDHGTLVQVWRGDFLDATPMWHNRGDGSSRPRGAVQHLASSTLTVAPLASLQATWASDTTGSSFRPRGYTLAAPGVPTFRYEAFGATVSDTLRVLEQGRGFQRSLSLQNSADSLYARLAVGNITEHEAGLYTVDDQSYYLRIDDADGATPLVRTVGDTQELVIPVRTKLTYSLMF